MPRPQWATAALVLSLPLAGQAAQEGEALLRKADALRYPWASFRMDVTLSFRGKAQQWQVRVAPNRDARIEGLSEKEKGRAILVLGEDMWLLMPSTRRPVRVTPQQRLMGPAAGGDLARAALAEDYTVSVMTPDTRDGKPVLRLDLEARRPSITYRTVRLWAQPDTGLPLFAEYRLASGKLARSATFDPPAKAQGRAVMAGMTLIEPQGGETHIRFDHWQPEPHAPEAFRLPPAP